MHSVFRKFSIRYLPAYQGQMYLQCADRFGSCVMTAVERMARAYPPWQGIVIESSDSRRISWFNEAHYDSHHTREGFVNVFFNN